MCVFLLRLRQGSLHTQTIKGETVTPFYMKVKHLLAVREKPCSPVRHIVMEVTSVACLCKVNIWSVGG